MALDPVAQLEQGWRRYTDFCLEHPAFLDCGISLMRRPAEELREEISDAVWIRLGQGMAACLGRLSRILAREPSRASSRSRIRTSPPTTSTPRRSGPCTWRALVQVCVPERAAGRAGSQNYSRSIRCGSKRPASPMCSPRSAPRGLPEQRALPEQPPQTGIPIKPNPEQDCANLPFQSSCSWCSLCRKWLCKHAPPHSPSPCSPCSPPRSAWPPAAPPRRSSKSLALVAYSTPQGAYEKLIPAFQATSEGKGVSFSQSYGPSGEQSRAVVNGLHADVVNFSLRTGRRKARQGGARLAQLEPERHARLRHELGRGDHRAQGQPEAHHRLVGPDQAGHRRGHAEPVHLGQRPLEHHGRLRRPAEGRQDARRRPRNT